MTPEANQSDLPIIYLPTANLLEAALLAYQETKQSIPMLPEVLTSADFPAAIAAIQYTASLMATVRSISSAQAIINEHTIPPEEELFSHLMETWGWSIQRTTDIAPNTQAIFMPDLSPRTMRTRGDDGGKICLITPSFCVARLEDDEWIPESCIATIHPNPRHQGPVVEWQKLHTALKTGHASIRMHPTEEFEAITGHQDRSLCAITPELARLSE